MTLEKPACNVSRKSHELLATSLLVATLLIAQVLGLMHGVVHVPQAGEGGKTPFATQPAQRAVSRTQRNTDGFMAALLSSHTGDNDCRLFDQASHGSPMPQVVVLSTLVVLPTSFVAIFNGEALARWATLFNARGPPLTS